MKQFFTINIFCAIILFFPCLLSAQQQGKEELMQAYKKEYAFLEAQREELEKRILEQKTLSGKQINKQEKELKELQVSLLSLTARADLQSEELFNLEQNSESSESDNENLLNMIQQATSSLASKGIKRDLTEESSLEQKIKEIPTLFQDSISLLDKYGSVSKTDDSYFLMDGTKVNGTIIKIGQIAAFGVSDDGSGALAPAGDGQFRLWNTNTNQMAKNILDNQKTENISLYLYESLEKPVENKEAKNALEIIRSGGVIAYVIVFLGLLSIMMIVLRSIFLYRASSRTESLIIKLNPIIKEGWLDNAIEICKETKGASARVLVSTIRNLDKKREQLDDIISESILHEIPYLNRFGSAITVFAAVAPLLGLLGTVTGMISTFDIITEFGTGDPRLLSGGISEALVTTELGLIVAIPTLLIGSLLTSWSQNIENEMEHASLTIVNTYKLEAYQKQVFLENTSDNAENTIIEGIV